MSKRKITAYCRIDCPHSDNTNKELLKFKISNEKIDIDIINVPNDNTSKKKIIDSYKQISNNYNTFPMIIYTSGNNQSYFFGGNDKLKNTLSVLSNLNYKKLQEKKKELSFCDYKILKWLLYINELRNKT